MNIIVVFGDTRTDTTVGRKEDLAHHILSMKVNEFLVLVPGASEKDRSITAYNALTVKRLSEDVFALFADKLWASFSKDEVPGNILVRLGYDPEDHPKEAA
jgi:hypothetical protein